jgi:hypothetical protein
MAKLVILGTEIEVSETGDESVDIAAEEPYPAHPHLRRRIDPVNLEVAFLRYCIGHGWLAIVSEGDTDSFFLTDEGETELRRFGLTNFT